MANLKITELAANTTPALVDIIPHVDDVAGTPTTKKVTLTLVDDLFRANDAAFVATASVTVASLDTENSIIGTGVGSLTLPAGFLTIGKTLHIRVMGVISNTGTPNMTVKLKLGSTVIASTGAVATITGLSNSIFIADFYLTCRTTGVTGTVFGQGTTQLGNNPPIGAPATAAITVDTTGTLAVGVTVQWGTSSASNTVTGSLAIVEKVN